MSRSFFSLAVCVSVTLLAGALSAASGSAPAIKAAPEIANTPISFAQAQSDLEANPAAHFGQLPNGMTYVLYKNRTPPGSAAVWLRVAAGSIMEQDDQRGLAHFVEHMAFNGSRNVPEGEMVKLLERDGLAFGADTNAQTSAFETLYTLNLPDASERIVDNALFLMRETAGNISFAPGAIERERGVVLGEERARGGAALDAYEAQLKFLFPGQKYSERLPIGKVEILRTAQRPAFMRFYNDFYRPEYATLIVVGDIDIDRVESEIRKRFADWRPGPQSSAGRTVFGAQKAPTTPTARSLTGAGLPDALSVSWTRPPIDVVQTKAKDFEDLLGVFSNTIVNERFALAASKAGSAFISAGVQNENIAKTARLFSLSITPKKGQDRAALTEAMAILRTFAAQGPGQAEVDRIRQQYDSYFRNRVAAARTMPTQAIAERIANAVRSQGVFQSPAQELAEIEEMRSSFTAGAIAGWIKKVGLDGPPRIWRQGEQENGFDEKAILAAYREAIGAPVGASEVRNGVKWPYTSFGIPSPIVSREMLPGVGATRVTYANGVTLTVKPTDYDDNGVGISVKFGNGLAGIRRDQAAALFAARQIGLFGGGLGQLTADEIRQSLAGTIYGTDFSVEGDAASLSGVTTKTDFELQLQLLAAFVIDPGLRPEALHRFKASLTATYVNMRSSPRGVYSLRASAAVFDDDPRFAMPSEDALRAVTNQDIAALIRDQIGHGPIEITIVGDVTVENAVMQVGATFGTLPPRPAAVALPGARRIRFPTTKLHRIYKHDGRADQNLSIIAWPTTDYFSNPRKAAGLELLAAIMTSRELEEVREKQSASYSARVNSAASTAFTGFGYLESSAAVRPEVDERYFQTVSTIASDLKAKPVGPDELTRARLPLIDRLRNQRNTNGFWMATLSGSLREPKRLASAMEHESNLRAITPAEIQALARQFLVLSRALRIQVKSADAPLQPSVQDGRSDRIRKKWRTR